MLWDHSLPAQPSGVVAPGPTVSTDTVPPAFLAGMAGAAALWLGFHCGDGFLKRPKRGQPLLILHLCASFCLGGFPTLLIHGNWISGWYEDVAYATLSAPMNRS